MEDAAVEFIIREGPKFDPAFGVNIVYDKQRAELRPRKPVHDLQEAIERFQKSDLKLKLNPTQCTWEDIIDAFEAAREEYERKASGIVGLARKVWRSTGNHANRITPLLDMIPDDMGLRTLRAGLVFIVTMAKESARKREAILAAFADIPLHFGLVERKRRLYPNDVALKSCSVELHDTLMQAIPQLITYLVPKKRFNLFPFIVKIPNETDVDKILATVKSKCDALHQQVKDIQEATIVDLAKTSQVTRDISFEIKASTEQIQDSTDRIENSATRIEKSTDKGNELGFQILDKVNKVQDNQEAIFRFLANNGLFQMLVGPPGIRRQEQNYRLLQGPFLGPETPLRALVTVEELLSIVGVDPEDILTRDLNGALGSSQSLDHATKSHSESLLQDPHFRRWYYSAESDMVLVDGSMNDIGSPSLRMTSLSSICAVLAAATMKIPCAVSLPFFCGLHTSPIDSMRGPGGLILAWIAIATVRLYRAGVLNLDFINMQQYVQALRTHDLSTLCDTFERLICQLSWDTKVYCVVDGITWCERSEWSEGLHEIIQTLVRLTQTPGRGPVLKVLMTCPVRSRETIRHFPFNLQEHQIILAHHQRYELEWDSDRVMELDARHMWNWESRPVMIGANTDQMDEDYT